METFLKVLFIGAALVTAGCAPTNIEEAQQNFLCQDSGVSSYTGSKFSKLHCNDGKTFEFSVIKATIITDPAFYATSK